MFHCSWIEWVSEMISCPSQCLQRERMMRRLSWTVEKDSVGMDLIRRSPIKLSKYVVMGVRVVAKARIVCEKQFSWTEKLKKNLRIFFSSNQISLYGAKLMYLHVKRPTMPQIYLAFFPFPVVLVVLMWQAK